MWARFTQSINRIRIRRPLVWLAFAAGLGTLAGEGLPGSLLPFWLGFTGLIVLLAALLRPRGAALAVLLAVATGLIFTARAACFFDRTVPPDGEYTVEGVVLQAPQLRTLDGHLTVQLRDVTLTDAAGQARALDGVYWTAYVDTAYIPPAPGDTVRVSGRLYAPSGQRNPYGFDFRRYLLQNHMTAGFYNSGEYEAVPEAPATPLKLAVRLRYALLSRLDTAFGERAALPKALLMGERIALAEEDRTAFARIGIAHVLAVSGLHISLIVTALGLLTRRFLSGRQQLWFFAIFLLSYAALLDFRASVVRASILTFAFLFSRSRGRSGDSLSAMALAFILILALSPVELSSSGFQLSFAAALGIVLLYQPVHRVVGRALGRKTGGLMASTLSAVAGTALPSIQTFHCFSLAGLLFSPVACALLTLLLPLCLAVLLLSCVWMDAARLLAWPVGLALRLMSDGVAIAARWPYMSLNCPSIPWPFIPLIVTAIVLFSSYAPRRWRGKRRAVLLAALFVCGSVLHLCTIDRGVSYLQLDVGSADCAVIQDGRHTTVVDCGEDGRDLSAYLLATGRRVNVLALTHLHADHCFGAQSLMDNGIPIDRLVLPVGANEAAVTQEALDLLARLEAYCGEVVTVSAGDTWMTLRTSARVLWPDQNSIRPGQDANNYSLCLDVRLESTTLLLTGDLTGAYEPYVRAHADILKSAHHGSRSSNTADFLAYTAPQTVIISVSATADAARPDGEVQARVKAAGADVYTTAACGMIRVVPGPAGYRVIRFIGEGSE